MSHDQMTTAPDGTTIAWSMSGSGSPVILVHGITENASSFGSITDRLAEQHQVVSLDLRGHGESGLADSYDLASMAGDVLTVIAAAGVSRPHLVGHSLGGAVVSAVGAAADVASIVNIDQSLQLGSFKDLLAPAEPMLRDPDQYHLVINGMFEAMMGDKLSADEAQRINGLRNPQQDVILGVWELILTQPLAEIEATLDAALGGFSGRSVPYLSLFGIDPGTEYAGWLTSNIDGAMVELWADHGHYPHLVDPERFMNTVEGFWARQ